MRVLCRHGYFCFYPKDETEVSRFGALFTQNLVRKDDFYTFPLLKLAPDYCLKGKPFLGVTASLTFEGNPWEIMRENGFVYDFVAQAVKLKSAVTQSVSIEFVDDYWTAESPLVMPGGIDDVGQKVLSYDAELSLDTSQLRIFGVEYE